MKEVSMVPELRFQEIVGEKLSNWERTSFSEIFNFSTGKNIKQKEASPEFQIPCVRYGELYHMYSEVIYSIINRTNLDRTELLFSHGDEILLPSAGEDALDIGSASALTIKDVAIGRTINILRPKENNVYSQIFASYYINQVLRKKIATLSRGASISNVYNSDLKNLKLNLPSLPEQKKIADFLSSVDERIDILTRKKGLIQQYKKGMLQQLFPRKGETTPQLRFKPARPLGGADDGSDFPEWEEKAIGQFVDYLTGFAFKSNNMVEQETRFPLMRGVNITEGYVRHSMDLDKYYHGDVSALSKYEVKEGDLVIGMDGSKVGRNSALITKQDSGALLVQRVARLRETDRGSLMFIYQHINSSIFHRYVDKVKTSSGIPHISSKDIKEFRISFPSIPEQKKIADFLTTIDEQIKKVTSQIEHMKTWKRGLLQKMFV